jgi:integrase
MAGSSGETVASAGKSQAAGILRDQLPTPEVDPCDSLWLEHKALEKAGTICRYVFHRHGRRIKGFRKAWANACEAAGLPGRIPHDLRRSAVRNMERAGLSRSVAMQLTGHKTEAVYRRYAITSEADLREGVERLNEATGTKRGDNRPHANADASKQSA